MIDQQSNEDFSLYYYIKNLIPSITVVDEFPVRNLVVPSISVEGDELEPVPWEMGNTHRVYRRYYSVNIFAVNKTQRQSILYQIMNALEQSIPVYDYNEGFPPDASPSQIGCLEVLGVSGNKIQIDPELVSKFYYRAKITFETYFNSL